MSVTANWDNEAKTVVRYDFKDKWTWAEFRTAATEAFAMTRSVPHRVDSISYFHHGATVPSDALFHFSRAMRDAPSNRGTTVIVGGSFFINNLVSTFSKIYKPLGQRLLIASTLDEARVKLYARRTKAVVS
jgi:hypothetical protein